MRKSNLFYQNDPGWYRPNDWIISFEPLLEVNEELNDKIKPLKDLMLKSHSRFNKNISIDIDETFPESNLKNNKQIFIDNY